MAFCVRVAGAGRVCCTIDADGGAAEVGMPRKAEI